MIARLAAIFGAAAIAAAQVGVRSGAHPGTGHREAYSACLNFSIAFGLTAAVLLLIDSYVRRSILFIAWVIVAAELLITWELYCSLLARVA
jgi:hypothetical protein